MRRLRRHGAAVAYLTAMLSLLLAAPAHAYIDPGSGSFLFQAIVGGAMAAGLAVKVFWRRIVAFFARSGPKDVTPTALDEAPGSAALAEQQPVDTTKS